MIADISRPTFHDRITRATSRVAVVLSVVFTLIILATLVCVVGYLITLGGSALSVGFFTDLPTGESHGNVGGMKHAVYGTLILIGLASVVGVPLGVLTGVYLSEYDVGSVLATPVRFICDVLAGVPSIVVGILGYELVVRPIGNYNGYAGAAALAFIMIPIVARTTEEMLRLVPGNYREASVGLGASKAETILKVVLPAATGSLVTGIMLAIARVAGETAPLLFTALGSRLLSTNPNEPMPSLTVQIFTYATGPSPEQQRLAWAGILVLIGLIFALNLAIRFAASRGVRGAR
ncbi:MAG TPA: phosphate ABC transporter permease PstA [Tepidisphaeraceae bacterium]|jgi:phosphate transport system permease protein